MLTQFVGQSSFRCEKGLPFEKGDISWELRNKYLMTYISASLRNLLAKFREIFSRSSDASDMIARLAKDSTRL